MHAERLRALKHRLAVLVALPGAVAAQSGDAFLCYATRPASGAAGSARMSVAVHDEWNEGSLDLRRAKNRGSLANPLFILNHFLTRTIGSPTLAEMVDHNPLFLDRALQCQAESGRLPNFVTVDFFDIGDLFAVVDALNGV